MVERIRTDTRLQKGDDPRRHKGRPKGARNRVGVLIKDAIIMAAEEMGEMQRAGIRSTGVWWKKGSGGLKGYLKWLAAHEPKAFAGLLSRVIPLHVVGDIEHTHHNAMTREDVIEELRERGIPIERIYGHDRVKEPPKHLHS